MSSDEYSVKLEFLKNAHIGYPGTKSAKTDDQVSVKESLGLNKIAVVGLDDHGKRLILYYLSF